MRDRLTYETGFSREEAGTAHRVRSSATQPSRINPVPQVMRLPEACAHTVANSLSACKVCDAASLVGPASAKRQVQPMQFCRQQRSLPG